MMQSIEFIKLLSLIGIPSIFAMVCYIFKMLKSQGQKIKILMDAQQAQMRRDLIEDYYRREKSETILERDLTSWVAQYNAYHALGANGVLDNIYASMMQKRVIKDEYKDI